MARTPKMRHCFNCGKEIGVYADHDRFDTCGSLECDREVRDGLAQERQEERERREIDDRSW